MKVLRGVRAGLGSLAAIALVGFSVQALGAELVVEPRIIGGQPVEEGDFPFAVQVFVEEDNRSGFCGGTVVDEEWILTAGHCVTGSNDQVLPPESFSVLSGTRFRNDTSGTLTEVTEVRLHPEYFVDRFNAPHNDLALLRLAETVDIEPIKVMENSPPPGEMSTIIGWGRTSNAPNAGLSSVLMEAQVPVVSNQDCNAEYGGIITDVMLCAGFLDGTADACVGDSGGPLMVMRNNAYRQAGIVSFGQECASTYGGYTRVSEFFDWLIGILGEGSDGDGDGDGGSGSFGAWWLFAASGVILLGVRRRAGRHKAN